MKFALILMCLIVIEVVNSNQPSLGVTPGLMAQCCGILNITSENDCARTFEKGSADDILFLKRCRLLALGIQLPENLVESDPKQVRRLLDLSMILKGANTGVILNRFLYRHFACMSRGIDNSTTTACGVAKAYSQCYLSFL